MRVLKFIWQLPQNLVALSLLACYKIGRDLIDMEIFAPKGTKVYMSRYMPSGISLGNFIILARSYLYRREGLATSVKHEYGHHKQSLYLGPLYLFIIGIPSLLGNIWDRLFHKRWTNKERSKWYYNQPWEKWADKLGGVQR